jgi:hypothetical protein
MRVNANTAHMFYINKSRCKSRRFMRARNHSTAPQVTTISRFISGKRQVDRGVQLLDPLRTGHTLVGLFSRAFAGCPPPKNMPFDDRHGASLALLLFQWWLGYI